METWSRKNVAETLKLMAALMAGNLVSLVFNVYIGRALDYGTLSVVAVMNTLWYLAAIAFNALNATVNQRVAYLSAHEGEGAAFSFYRGTAGRTFAYALTASVLLILLAFRLGRFLNIGDPLVLVSFSPAMVAGPLIALNIGYFNGRFRFGLTALVIIAEALVKLFLAVGLVNAGMSGLVYLSIPGSALVSVLLSLVLVRMMGDEPLDHKGGSFPRGFFAGALMTGLAVNVFLTLDMVLVKHFFRAEIAGQYALLALSGKMIFFAGSLLSNFMLSFVGRDLGAERDTAPTFRRIMAGVLAVVAFAVLLFHFSGHIFLPLVFGEKALAVLPYLRTYSLAIGLLTLSSTIVYYHLARNEYRYTFLSLAASAVMAAGIVLNHGSLGMVVRVISVAAALHLVIVAGWHILERHWNFILRGVVDLMLVFVPAPKSVPGKKSGLRILIYNWRDIRHRYAGGAEVYIHELSKRWVAGGNKVTVFCGNDGHHPRQETMDGVEIYRRGGFYLVYIWAFVYYLFRFRGQYDVVVDCQNGIPFFTPLYVREKTYCLMFHVHQDVFYRSLAKPLAALAKLLESRLTPWAYSETPFLTISESSRKGIRELGLGRKGIHVVHPGVKTGKLAPWRKSAKPLVVYVGRLKYYKSLDVFIRAAKKLSGMVPGIEFVIAGDGEERERLRRLAEGLGVLDRVSFWGHVSEAEKQELYQRAWVAVNPSFMEGWGLTSIEANAYGTPVVASDVPGLSDSVRNPSSGFVVPYGDFHAFAAKIKLLVDDKKTRKDMSAKAYDWASRFSWQKSSQAALDILRK